LLTDHFESKRLGLTLNQLEQFLLQAYQHYRAWCREKKIAATSLRFNLNRFGRDSWVSMPELTTQYKASTVKYLQYWLYDFLMDEPGDIPSAQDRRHCSYALAKFQYMLDMHGEWFSQDMATRTAGFGFSFLLFYQKLAWRSRAEPHNNYKIVPKFHYYFHLCEYIERTLRNPRQDGIKLFTKVCPKKCLRKVGRFVFNLWGLYRRYEHCYPDESLMGQVSRIASRTHANTMERTTLHRYRALMDLFLAAGLNEEDPTAHAS
jgi:hypothetical protein